MLRMGRRAAADRAGRSGIVIRICTPNSSLPICGGGKTDDKQALRAAIRKADFKSLRGDFAFGANGFPVQNFYLVKVAKRPDGKMQVTFNGKPLYRFSGDSKNGDAKGQGFDGVWFVIKHAALSSPAPAPTPTPQPNPTPNPYPGY